MGRDSSNRTATTVKVRVRAVDRGGKRRKGRGSKPKWTCLYVVVVVTGPSTPTCVAQTIVLERPKPEEGGRPSTSRKTQAPNHTQTQDRSDA